MDSNSLSLFPHIRHTITDFLTDEEANVPRSKIMSLGAMMLVLSFLLMDNALARHGSHSSHGSHGSHSSHSSHSSHTSSTHTTHSSHSTHSNGSYPTQPAETATPAPDLVYRIPDTIESIGKGSFVGTPAKEIYIPKSVTKIAEGAFDKDVTLVFEDGLSALWAIDHGYDYRVEPPKS